MGAPRGSGHATAKGVIVERVYQADAERPVATLVALLTHRREAGEDEERKSQIAKREHGR